MVSDDVYQEYTGKEPKKVTEDIYRMGRDFIDVLDMKPENFVDKKSGYQGALYFNYRTSEFIFANRGTDTKLGRHEAVKDAVASIAQGSDFNSTQYEFGINLAIDLQIALGSSPLTFTGHSLGGGIASAQAGRLKSSAVTFNAAGLSDGTIERYGMDRNHLKKNVYAFYTPGEILSTLQASPVVDSVLNQWGTVPKNLLAAVMALNDVSYGRDIGWHRFGPGQMPEAAGTRIAVPAVNEAKQPLPWQSYLDPVDLHDMQYFINAFK